MGRPDKFTKEQHTTGGYGVNLSEQELKEVSKRLEEKWKLQNEKEQKSREREPILREERKIQAQQRYAALIQKIRSEGIDDLFVLLSLYNQESQKFTNGYLEEPFYNFFVGFIANYPWKTIEDIANKLT